MPLRRARCRERGQIKIQTSRVQAPSSRTARYRPATRRPCPKLARSIVNGYYVDQDSDERAGTPSLRRKQLDVAGGAPTITDLQIVPGVEDLQVELGGDFNGDQNADYFVPPNTAIPVGDQIVAVRIWLLVRAEQQEQDSRTTGPTATAAASALSNTPGDAFRRVLVSKTIALRNTRR